MKSRSGRRQRQQCHGRPKLSRRPWIMGSTFHAGPQPTPEEVLIRSTERSARVTHACRLDNTVRRTKDTSIERLSGAARADTSKVGKDRFAVGSQTSTGRHGHAAHRQHAQVDVTQALAALQAQAPQARQTPQRVHARAARPPARRSQLVTGSPYDDRHTQPVTVGLCRVNTSHRTP